MIKLIISSIFITVLVLFIYRVLQYIYLDWKTKKIISEISDTAKRILKSISDEENQTDKKNISCFHCYKDLSLSTPFARDVGFCRDCGVICLQYVSNRIKDQR